MSTRAISYLARKKIAHQVVAYAHEEKRAQFAARTVGFHPAHAGDLGERGVLISDRGFQPSRGNR